MGEKKSARPGLIKNLLTDRFIDTWKLLSETSRFLARTQVFSLYEEELRSWRHDLQATTNGSEEEKRIRQEIVELRVSLRQQGFDLSLAKQDLVLDGFRNDASLGEGFRRVVVFFTSNGLHWLAGDDNHVTLAGFLDRQMISRYRKHNAPVQTHSKHYLWYRRSGNTLILSGSDTETKDDYQRLKAMADANSLAILAGLKDLR